MARNKYPEETVRRILDVAQRLLSEKGYDETSIQDIIDGLGGLSKGAVYYHFKSKEEIFEAVEERCNQPLIQRLRDVRDDASLNGHQKLKKMFQLSIAGSYHDIVYSAAPNILENPKLLAMQVKEIFADDVPHYIQPVIEQGIADGSIKTDYPQELSEAMILLTNLWLNPFVVASDAASMERRIRFFDELLSSIGLEFLDEATIDAYKRYCALSTRDTDKQ